MQAVISDPQKGFYLVAQINNGLVGNLMITCEWSDWRNRNIWWIQSVYVRKEFRNKGIYSELYKQVIKQAKKEKVNTLRLYVEKNNLSAKKVYKKLGMQQGIYDFYETVI